MKLARIALGFGALGLVAFAVLPVVPASAPAAAADLVVPRVTVTPLGMSVVYAVSKSGRYVVGWHESRADRMVLRDTFQGRTVKVLPRKATIGSLSISDSGRYVTFTVPGAGKLPAHDLQRDVRVYDRSTGRTRSAATTSSGKTLRPSWRTTCTAAGSCDEDRPITAAPQLNGGQISGNGRYVVFCANYLRPDRVDLYIKNWRTKKLSTVKGACAYDSDLDVGSDWVRAPAVSEDGSTIVLPGQHLYGEEGVGRWTPSKALFDRRRLVEIGGLTPTTTHDGRIISITGEFRRDASVAVEPPLPVIWWDVRAGTRLPADPAGLQLTMSNSSRHGRYVVYPTTAVPRGFTLVLADRLAGVRYDLGAALAAAGHPIAASNTQLISGDGTRVFAETGRGWVSVVWALP